MLNGIILLGLGHTGLFAQETVTVSGGVATGGSGSVSFTVGQTLYSTHTGSNGSVAQGVQQPYEISVISGIDSTEGFFLTIIAYPNPTRDLLTLKIENYKSENLFFRVFDLSGKLLEVSKLNDYDTHISMSKYPPAVYLLKIYEKQKEIKVFKIIKN